MENPQGQPDDAGVVQLLKKKKTHFSTPKNALDLGLPSVVQEGLLKTSVFVAFFFRKKKHGRLETGNPNVLKLRKMNFFSFENGGFFWLPAVGF